MGARLPQRTAEIDHDAGEVTVSITFRFAPGYSVDKCETGHFLGSMRQELVRWLLEQDGFGQGEDRMVTGFSYSCWDPYEETDLGNIADYTKATCVGCSRPTRQRSLDHPQCWEWEHVDPIPLGDDDLPDCHHLAHQDVADDLDFPDVLVRFANMLEVNLAREASR